MKTINIFFISILMASVIGLNVSCDSVSNPDPIKVIDSTKTATISGTAYANLDETNDTTFSIEKDYERAPKETTVKVVVDNSDYKSGSNGTKSYQTTIGQDGTYTIDFPATDESMNVDITFDSFRADQVQQSDSSKVQKQYTPVSTMPSTISVSADITKYQDVEYMAN